MSRTEEKLKYVDFTKNFEKLSQASCNTCGPNTPSIASIPTALPNPLLSSIETNSFIPSNRNMNYQNINNENNLLFGMVNREHTEMIETDMPARNSYENFGSISSNDFMNNSLSGSLSGSPSGSSGSWYDLNNDVLQQIVQEYDRVKDKGEFYTFKSTPRRQNVDLSSHMPPPQKTLGRGFGNVNDYEKIYLGEQTRSNDYRPIVRDAERIDDVPYYLTAQPIFKNLGGDDTRYLNSKLR
jgi:hypothetical protein